MNIIFFIILFPFFGFLFLSFSQGLLSYRNASRIGIFSIFIPFLIICYYGLYFVKNTHYVFVKNFWNWIDIIPININVSITLDSLSFSMLFMIIGVGLLIHIFSYWYMQNQNGFSRFFAYTNLFIASMSLLVLADNFLLMYLGWEGVSVCSYLLIGFYYKKLNNINCAFKAFIITRISDVFLIFGIFLLYNEYGTINFQEVKFLTNFLNIEHFYDLHYITLFLLIGVIGKSAQLPLQTWLSDAMVGPTPVSALIHAATMVTAGVYLIARTYFLFLLTEDILYLIGVIGTITILLSSFSALVQSDIKRILAYSTMSQIGYMFLALSVKAWNAAIIHLIVHAVFKALLFLSAGSLILTCSNEKNIFKLGGLRKKLPFLYINFLVGGASLVSFPLVTAGFYSKGKILFNVLNSGHIYFFWIALFCSFLTSLYTFRMIFVVFHGTKSIHKIITSKTLEHNVPLFVLLFFSTFFSSYIFPSLSDIFPISNISKNNQFIFEIICSVLSISGILFSYYFWIKKRVITNKIFQFKLIKFIYNILLNGWFFDRFYNFFFVNFYLYISRILHFDVLNKINYYALRLIQICNFYLLKTSNGMIKWYISSVILGINFIFLLVLVYYFIF